MQQVIDCEGTIRTLLVLNNSLRPLSERETALIDIEFIRKRYQILPRADFESNADIERRLIRLKELTEKIVQEDHKRKDENLPQNDFVEV